MKRIAPVCLLLCVLSGPAWAQFGFPPPKPPTMAEFCQDWLDLDGPGAPLSCQNQPSSCGAASGYSLPNYGITAFIHEGETGNAHQVTIAGLSLGGGVNDSEIGVINHNTGVWIQYDRYGRQDGLNTFFGNPVPYDICDPSGTCTASCGASCNPTVPGDCDFIQSCNECACEIGTVDDIVLEPSTGPPVSTSPNVNVSGCAQPACESCGSCDSRDLPGDVCNSTTGSTVEVTAVSFDPPTETDPCWLVLDEPIVLYSVDGDFVVENDCD